MSELIRSREASWKGERKRSEKRFFVLSGDAVFDLGGLWLGAFSQEVIWDGDGAKSSRGMAPDPPPFSC